MGLAVCKMMVKMKEGKEKGRDGGKEEMERGRKGRIK